MRNVIVTTLGIFLTACGGGGSSVGPTSPTSTGTPSTGGASSIPFLVCAEWSDALWSVSFGGQTFSGGGAASALFPGKQCFRFSAPAGTQTLTGTMRLANPDEFGALGISVAATSFTSPGPQFGSVRVVSGPPGAFVNYCYATWAEYPYRIPAAATPFAIQFVLAPAGGTVCF